MIKGLSHYENASLLRVLTAWASKMDCDMNFNSANELDNAAKDMVCNETEAEDMLKTILKIFDGKEQDLDDGLFGLNDTDNPTSKAA